MSVDERGADAGPLGPTQEGPGGRQPAARAAIEGRSPWALAIQRLRKDRAAMISLGFIILIILIAIFAPVFASITGHPPNEQYHGAQALTEAGLPKGPSGEFWWGTDDLGRDVLVRTAYGARISLLVGVTSSASAMTVGVAVGVLAGYFGGVTDAVLGRLIDIVLSLPFLLAAIALETVLGPSLLLSILVIAFFSWAAVARIVRGQTLSIREKEFIEAARSIGTSDLRIIRVDVLPQLAAPVIVYTTLLIPASIAFEATLSYLGLGVVPPTPDWGNMLSEATGYYQVAWWFILFPGLGLLSVTLAFNLLGDSIRDALDPRADGLLLALRRR
jgi:ABC-type dipeptide/oligopeptide/nickel transport system permease subunit